MTLKRLQAGLAVLGYNGGNSAFLNWFKIAREPSITRSDGGPLEGKVIFDAGGYLDASTGDIIAGSHVLTYSCVFWSPVNSFVTGLGCDFSGESWVVKWDGSATGTIDFLTSGHAINTSVPNQITFTMGTNPDNTQLTLTVTNSADPPRNILIYQSRYATNVANGEMFNPDWLAEASKFGTLRTMDWQYTNNSDIVNFSDLADESFHRWGKAFGTGDQTAVNEFGAKGGMPVSVLARLANDSGTKIHVCLPSKCTDAFVTSFATYLKNNTTQTVIYEYTNETWHSSFGQYGYCQTNGLIIWPEYGPAGSNFPWEAAWRWYGYRSAAIMKIIRDIYNDSSRWHGTINTSSVGSGYVLSAQLDGISYWRQNVLSPANSIAVNGLFKSFMPAAYFGAMNDYITQGVTIDAIYKENPCRVQSNGHGLTTGARKKFFVQGMTQLNNTFQTVTVLNANEFTLNGVNATGYGTFTSGFYMRPEFFDLCDESASQNLDGSPYKYFNQQFAQLCLTGTCDEGLTISEQYLADYKNTQWPALKTLAVANGVEMRQYEGGNHFVANGYLWSLGESSQYATYLFNCERSQEVADVYAESHRAAIAFGFKEPSKYLMDGIFTPFGVWAGVCFWPLVANGNTADTAHPVWQALSAVRDGPVADSYTVNW